jgi:hypothetical protein
LEPVLRSLNGTDHALYSHRNEAALKFPETPPRHDACVTSGHRH